MMSIGNSNCNGNNNNNNNNNNEVITIFVITIVLMLKVQNLAQFVQCLKMSSLVAISDSAVRRPLLSAVVQGSREVHQSMAGKAHMHLPNVVSLGLNLWILGQIKTPKMETELTCTLNA